DDIFVPKLRDENLYRVTSHGIKHHPDVILDVIYKDELTAATFSVKSPGCMKMRASTDETAFITSVQSVNGDHQSQWTGSTDTSPDDYLEAFLTCRREVKIEETPTTPARARRCVIELICSTSTGDLKPHESILPSDLPQDPTRITTVDDLLIMENIHDDHLHQHQIANEPPP
ncbi:hypothetical protein BGZ83_011804, partial [Gryganskiella cystojenkinii]